MAKTTTGKGYGRSYNLRARGVLRCPTCHKESMIQTRTKNFDVVAVKGAVVKERIYTCQTDGCGARIRTEAVSQGPTSKAYLRSGK